MKKRKIIITSRIVLSIVLILCIPFIVLLIRTSSLASGYSYLKTTEAYSDSIRLDDVKLITQHISCGYATIEMLSDFYKAPVTEDALSDKNNGKITTSSTNGFLKELNASIPAKSFKKQVYLKNDVLLKRIYTSLSEGNPVAFQWAALYEGEWTLHFSVVVGMDLKNDKIIINNPYGFVEELTIDEFISRTTFKAYEDMPLFLKLGFVFGVFHKNAVFIAEEKY